MIFLPPRFNDTGLDEGIRMSALRKADIVLLCCSVQDLQTYDLPVLASELKVFKEGVETESVVLVGTKSDLKEDEEDKRGGIVATELGLQYFLECSSTSTDSVRELVKKVIDISYNTTGGSRPKTYPMFLYSAFQGFLEGVTEKEEILTLESSQDNLPPLKGLNPINTVFNLVLNEIGGDRKYIRLL